jgi:hypothetical protein
VKSSKRRRGVSLKKIRPRIETASGENEMQIYLSESNTGLILLDRPFLDQALVEFFQGKLVEPLQ